MNEFEKAVLNGPSVFEPLKFYCMYKHNTFLLFLSFALGCKYSLK